MQKILLIQPPIEDFYFTAKRTIPYGLAIIAKILQNNGLQVKILDALATPRNKNIPTPPELQNLGCYYIPDRSPYGLFFGYKHFGYSWEYLAQQIQSYGPDLVGISSLCTAYSAEAIHVAEIVKQVCPNAYVVVGGHHATALPEEVMRHSCVDYCLRGEGEVSLPALISALQHKTSLADVPGIVMRKNIYMAAPQITNPQTPASPLINSQAQTAAPPLINSQAQTPAPQITNIQLDIHPPAIVHDLNELPWPALDCVANTFYQRTGTGSAVIVSSRGCPLHCSYCCVAEGSWLKYRRRTVESVLAEIDYVVREYKVRFIDFEDENISLDREWFLSLLHGIQSRYGNSIELRAMNGLYPPTLDQSVIEAMSRAGFRALNLSLGTTNDQQLQRFRRKNVCEALENAINYGIRYGLAAVVYIIVAAPGQDPIVSAQDLLYLAKLPVVIGTSIYYPAPGSADYKICQERGLLPSHLSQMRSTALPISETTNRLQAITLLRLTRIINFAKSLLDQGYDLPLAYHPPKFDTEVKLADMSVTCQNTATTKSISIPETFAASLMSLDRIALGQQLLSYFLYNGDILGIAPKSNLLFCHEADKQLCEIVARNFVIQKTKL